MTGWESLRALRLAVTELAIDARELEVRPDWSRRTRLITFSGPAEPDAAGAGHCAGLGEELTWTPVNPDEILALYPEDLLCHSGTLAEWAARLDAREATPAYLTLAAGRGTEPDFLRWALESAAVELALRQNRTTLATVLDCQPRPLRFCLSMGLGAPPTAERLRAWRQHGAYRFKLDAAPSWTPALLAELRKLDAVDIVDFKAYYHDTPVDQPVDAALYRRVAEGLPSAILEDAMPCPETRAILQQHAARLSWDAPIHSVEDLERTVPDELQPVHWLNIKPSRFGTWRRLLQAYDWAAATGARLYGGGQFELGIGREQAQALAMLFHPDAPNDLAPVSFHTGEPRAGLPENSLSPQDLSQTGWLAAPGTPG